jgi:hypothetical protein
MKDLLITMPKVETLEEFITQAITCDNRLFKRHQEKKIGWGNVSHSMISTSSTLEKNVSGPEPLLQDEKDKHCREGLCYYCGSSKYKLPECPIKPKGLKA